MPGCTWRDGTKALALVATLVWDAKSPPDEPTLKGERCVNSIIRSYTLSGKGSTTPRAAVIRYRQDYPAIGSDWPPAQPRLYLRFLGQPQSALDALQGVKGDEAEMLSLLASLRAGQTAPGDVLAQAVHIGSDSKVSVQQKQVHAWLITAGSGGRSQNPVRSYPQALQDALELATHPSSSRTSGNTLTPDMLWML